MIMILNECVMYSVRQAIFKLKHIHMRVHIYIRMHIYMSMHITISVYMYTCPHCTTHACAGVHRQNNMCHTLTLSVSTAHVEFEGK